MGAAAVPLDPVAAYDLLAPVYGQVAARRARYLASIEDLIVSSVPRGARALLDVGTGDGERGLRIARRLGARTAVLVEPSAQMAGRIGTRPILPLRAEQITADSPTFSGRRFDVITCLWNVLGHIDGEAARIGVLSQLARLLAHDGLLFVDVQHRYNACAYGLPKTAARLLYDRLWPGERNGDVVVRWQLGAVRCATYGHVFSRPEVERIAAAAGLVAASRRIVDYETGCLRRFAVAGNLLYAFRRSRSSS